jgi:DMSO/TMAO reductase YedYZ molybdopterin-dependent catalytic subunit
MISWHGNHVRRVLLGGLLVLALVSCAPAIEHSDSTPAASTEQAPPPSPTAPGDAARSISAEPSPIPSATASSGASEAVPVGIEQMNPADVDNNTLPITPVEELHHTGRPQEYDIETYRLVVDGLVEKPLSLSYDEVLGFPQVTETVLLICPGVFWDNAEWTGTPLSLILEEAGVLPGASRVEIVGAGNYRKTFSLEESTADGVFLAYEVNGQTLPPDHGYPFRLVVRHRYGSNWVKWVERIGVLP